MSKKGYAIHFGLDEVDNQLYATQYKRKLEPLVWSAKDAQGLAEITHKQGFEVHLRTNETATYREFLKLLTTTISSLEAEDLLIISFSGHGSKAENTMFKDDEAFDGCDQLMCFYDDILLDDHFFYQICQAPEGSRIHFIIDSCHSGGMEKLEEVGEAEPLSLPFEKFRPEVRIDNYTGQYSDLAIKASTIFWGAARPSALAGNGLFTRKIMEVWKADRGRSDYRRFYNTLRQRMPVQYKPASPSGANNESFLREKPFQIH